MSKSKRPEGWNQSAVLAWCEEHVGAALGDVCRAFENADCSASKLAYDLHCWRGSDDAFRVVFDGLVANETRGAGHALESEPGMEDWQLRWAECYLRTRDKIEASRVVGLSWGYVQRRLRPRDPAFDRQFAALVEQVESFFLSSAESDVELGLRIARETGDARTLLFGALKVLEVRSGEKWGRKDTLKVEGSVEHKHVVEIRQAQSRVEERARFLFAKRVAAPALEAPPITLELPSLVQTVESVAK